MFVFVCCVCFGFRLLFYFVVVCPWLVVGLAVAVVVTKPTKEVWSFIFHLGRISRSNLPRSRGPGFDLHVRGKGTCETRDWQE